jgi:uncharacterized protein (TIGR03067 family)
MYRLTTALVVTLTGLTLAAPRPKEPAKAEPPVLGKWRLVLHNGSKAGFSLNLEYFADGTSIGSTEDSDTQVKSRFKTDTSASPAQLDYLYDDKPSTLCIFKVAGDTLTVCYSFGKDRSRPKEFGQESTITLTFTRIKSKD